MTNDPNDEMLRATRESQGQPMDAVPSSPEGRQEAAVLDAASEDRAETIIDNPKSWIAWKRQADSWRRVAERLESEKQEALIPAKPAVEVVEAHPPTDAGVSEAIDAILKPETGLTAFDVLANYRDIRRRLQDARAALSTAIPEGDGVPPVRAELCPRCFGTGLDGGTTSIQCWKCRGAGAVVIRSTASTAGKG